MTENKGDLISREALIKALLNRCRSEVECLNHFWYDENIIALIDNAPTVERPQVEWKCPECGEWLFVCPNCGADMRGGAE